MSFLDEPAETAGQQALYDKNLEEDGFVWDLSRLWGHDPELWEAIGALQRRAAEAAGLSPRDKAMLVLGTSSTLGDSYCSTAWGRFLSEWAGPEAARAVLTQEDDALTARERALAGWARRLAADPNGTGPEDLQALRDEGFGDAQILALTFFGALRLAMSVTNDALGARPDVALAAMLDPSVRDVITWGRAPA